MCVNTMVLMRPTRREIHAATGKEKAENPRPEEEQAGGAQRQIEVFEEPQRQQGLDHEAASECVQAEQSGELVDDGSRRPEGRRRFPGRRRWPPRDSAVEEAAGYSEQGVEHEHRLDGRQLVDPCRRQILRGGGSQRAESGAEGTDQIVAGEHSGAVVIGHLSAQNRMFQRHEYADAPRRRIDRARECDHQQEGKVVHERERNPGRNHQARAGQQKPLPIVACTDKPDTERQQR